MSPRITVIGSVNVDLFAQVPHHPRPGETILGDSGQRTPGGKGANQALAARFQGAAVTFVGAVGSDSDAAIATERLRTAGVDLEELKVTAETPTGLAAITVSADGENTIVVLPGANASVTPEDVRSAVARAGEHPIVLLQGELPRETTEAAIRRADDDGHRVVLNLAPWGEIAPDVLRTVDPLVLNEHEAAAVATALELEIPEAPTELATALASSGIRSVVLTLGPHGAVVADRSGARAVPAPSVSAVDTTGAGDAFIGGLVSRLAAGESLLTAASHAVRVGAYSVRHPGAQPSYPTTEDELP
ncbi:ribokinase [Actinopolyspora halophila]|uniref:ribokinase n=1 Tax=Actinopolyspora halophila TaxID=1850 RepID=UPI000377B8A0|nr:ribokinase [Actinopolyspora halophila]